MRGNFPVTPGSKFKTLSFARPLPGGIDEGRVHELAQKIR
jgi:hypothetical protein